MHGAAHMPFKHRDSSTALLCWEFWVPETGVRECNQTGRFHDQFFRVSKEKCPGCATILSGCWRKCVALKIWNKSVYDLLGGGKPVGMSNEIRILKCFQNTLFRILWGLCVCDKRFTNSVGMMTGVVWPQKSEIKALYKGAARSLSKCRMGACG